MFAIFSPTFNICFVTLPRKSYVEFIFKIFSLPLTFCLWFKHIADVIVDLCMIPNDDAM